MQSGLSWLQEFRIAGLCYKFRNQSTDIIKWAERITRCTGCSWSINKSNRPFRGRNAEFLPLEGWNILEFSRPGYHVWLKCVPSNAEKRCEDIKAKIKDIYDESKQNYDTPKIIEE